MFDSVSESIDQRLWCKSSFEFSSVFSIPLVTCPYARFFLFSLCCISLVVEIISLLFPKLIRSSLYCLTFERWLGCRSIELFTLMSMKGFLKYCAKSMSIYMIRWSDDEMYPNDGVSQIVKILFLSRIHNQSVGISVCFYYIIFLFRCIELLNQVACIWSIILWRPFGYWRMVYWRQFPVWFHVLRNEVVDECD